MRFLSVGKGRNRLQVTAFHEAFSTTAVLNRKVEVANLTKQVATLLWFSAAMHSEASYSSLASSFRVEGG